MLPFHEDSHRLAETFHERNKTRNSWCFASELLSVTVSTKATSPSPCTMLVIRHQVENHYWHKSFTSRHNFRNRAMKGELYFLQKTETSGPTVHQREIPHTRNLRWDLFAAPWAPSLASCWLVECLVPSGETGQ